MHFLDLIVSKMIVTETPVPTWKNPELVFKPNKYPQSRNPDLPRNYFVSLFVGGRGAGKTHTICKLLKEYEEAGFDGGQDMRVVLMSPTSDANPVWTSLTTITDVIPTYSDEKLLEVASEIREEKDATDDYRARLKLYRKFLRVEPSKLSHEEVLELEKMDFEPPEPPRYPHGCVTFLILDDLVGSSAFKAVGKSCLTNLVLKNRHLGINLIIATQNLRAITKSIRNNTSVFSLFRFANAKTVSDDLYEEVSNIVSPEQFHALFVHATRDDHDCLVIDFTAPKGSRFKLNFSKILNLGGG